MTHRSKAGALNSERTSEKVERILSLPNFLLFTSRETRRPIELLAFGMSSDQSIGTQLEEVAAIFKSKFSNHAFEPL
jgi:hypothetical protein